MKRLVPIAALMLLGSCSPAGPVVRAQITGADVVFQAFEPGGWLSSSTKVAPMSVDRFAVFSREGAVWVIERTDPKCATGSGDSTFPITYGRVPACFSERLPAKPLKAGVVYRTDIGDDYRVLGYGYPSMAPFRLKLGIDTLSDDEQRQAWQDWPRETHPNATHPPPSANNASDPENSAVPEPAGITVANEAPPS